MVQSKEYYQKIITENLYLHFFSREIYRGIYGERIERMQIGHSDILATIMLCGYNTMFGSYAAYHETVKMLTEKGRIYRELTDYGIIKVCGATLNSDMILEHKQEIYYHDKDKYPGYFNTKKVNELKSIIPTDVKPDITDKIETLFLKEKWDKIIDYAPSDMDARIIKTSKETILKVIKNRENKAITKSIFNVDKANERLSSCVGRTLTKIYVDDYRKFANGDIVTGVPGLKEYDNLSVHFPFHDYEVLKELLMHLGFPKNFALDEFEALLKHYYSQEHKEFALKLQELLYLLYSLRKNKSIKLPVETIRISFLSVIREKLCGLQVKNIDFTAKNFFIQCIENVEFAISVVNKDKIRKGRNRNMKNKKVFVVTGRDEKLRLSIFSLLRALKLEPMEWMDVIRCTEQPSAYLYDAIKKVLTKLGR